MNAALALPILDLISHVHLQSLIIMLPKQLKYFTFSSCFGSIIIFTGDADREKIIITLVVRNTLHSWATKIKQKLPMYDHISMPFRGTGGVEKKVRYSIHQH
jgi:hypothetical protein